MRTRITKYLLLGGTSFLIFACSKYPSDVLPQKKMVDVLCDVHLVQSIYQNKAQDFDSNQKKDALVSALLEKHGITQAILDSSLVWYSDHPDLYTRVSDSVAAVLRRKQTLYAEEFAKEGVSHESIVPRYYTLDARNSNFSFRLDSLKIEELGGDIIFEFNALGAINSKIDAQVAFEFPDTTLYVTKQVNRNTSYKFERPTYPLGLVRVSGFIHLQPRTLRENILLYKMQISVKKND